HTELRRLRIGNVKIEEIEHGKSDGTRRTCRGAGAICVALRGTCAAMPAWCLQPAAHCKSGDAATPACRATCRRTSRRYRVAPAHDRSEERRVGRAWRRRVL